MSTVSRERVPRLDGMSPLINTFFYASPSPSVRCRLQVLGWWAFLLLEARITLRIRSCNSRRHRGTIYHEGVGSLVGKSSSVGVFLPSHPELTKRTESYLSGALHTLQQNRLPSSYTYIQLVGHALEPGKPRYLRLDTYTPTYSPRARRSPTFAYCPSKQEQIREHINRSTAKYPCALDSVLEEESLVQLNKQCTAWTKRGSPCGWRAVAAPAPPVRWKDIHWKRASVLVPLHSRGDFLM